MAVVVVLGYVVGNENPVLVGGQVIGSKEEAGIIVLLTWTGGSDWSVMGNGESVVVFGGVLVISGSLVVVLGGSIVIFFFSGGWFISSMFVVVVLEFVVIFWLGASRFVAFFFWLEVVIILFEESIFVFVAIFLVLGSVGRLAVSGAIGSVI